MASQTEHMLEVYEMIRAVHGQVFVHFDPRKAGSDIPGYLRNKEVVVLVYGDKLPVPTSEVVDAKGVKGVLRFTSPLGERFYYDCYVPWESVYAIVGPEHKGFMWKEPPGYTEPGPELEVIRGGGAKSTKPPAKLRLVR